MGGLDKFGGGATSPESRKIFEYFSVKLYKFCGFIRANIFFFYQNICHFMFETMLVFWG